MGRIELRHIFVQNQVTKTKLALFFVFLVLLTPHVLFLFQPYVMDEGPILRNVLTFFSEVTLVPSSAKYPTLYSYMAAVPIAVGAITHHVFDNFESLKDTVSFLYRVEPLKLIFPARVLSLLLLIAGGTVLVRFCWERCGALASVLVFAILMASPAFLRYGSLGLPDTAVFFFSALSIIYAVQFLETFEDKKTIRYLLLASIFSGFAISTKYNALATVVPIGVSIIFLYLNKTLRLTKGLLLTSIAAVTCIAALLIGSPGWLIAPELFFSELMYEVAHAKRGHLGASGVPVIGHIEMLILGAPVVTGSSLFGFLFWVYNRDRTGWMALTAILSVIALVATSSKQSLHYMYPAFPAFLIFSAMFWRELENRKRTLGIGDAKLRHSY